MIINAKDASYTKLQICLQLGCSVISACLQSCKWQVISASLTFLTTIDTYRVSTLKEKSTRVAKFDKLSKSSC
jgi:hypothetical protein